MNSQTRGGNVLIYPLSVTFPRLFTFCVIKSIVSSTSDIVSSNFLQVLLPIVCSRKSNSRLLPQKYGGEKYRLSNKISQNFYCLLTDLKFGYHTDDFTT